VSIGYLEFSVLRKHKTKEQTNNNTDAEYRLCYQFVHCQNN